MELMFCQFHFFVVPLRPKYKFEYKEDEVEKKSSSARNFQHAEIL